jgi:hypothetical protein
MTNIYYKIVESKDKFFDLDYIGRRTTNQDWSSIYLQTTISHALNYLEHKAYLTQNKYLLLIELQTNLDSIIINDPIFGSNEIDGDSKSKILKEKFNISSDLLLMDNMKNPLLLLDNSDEYELIVPHYLFNKDNFNINILKLYEVNSKTKFGMELKTTKELDT